MFATQQRSNTIDKLAANPGLLDFNTSFFSPRIGTKVSNKEIVKGNGEAASAGILERIAAGDRDAVQECLNQYSGLVWSLARRMLPNKEEAEDAVQEIFIEIWKNAERFDASQASETTFVAMIARRRLIDRLRKATRQPHIDSFEDMLVEPANKANEFLEMSVEANQASQLMADLKPDQRKILHLSIVEGYSHSEIAESLSMPLGTVKTHARRGLIQVRELLEAKNQMREVSA
ncbi:MAG: RNA polymerase sigma factor [Acidobacteriota bacterium]|nr:RNA polymerase sigma factor [Acidobacteriota bacterium]MDH3529206.1 RNA polymerase sigma factor [Acidobacteriota bacterium]